MRTIRPVVVDVKDTGKGLDAVTLEHLFDPFHTTKPDGMGIGLAISRSMIEAHGGKAVGDAELAARRGLPVQPAGAVKCVGVVTPG